jgi:hypothetical protein
MFLGNVGGLSTHNTAVDSKTNELVKLVVRVPGYRSRDPGSTLGTTEFFLIMWVAMYL